jgi:2-polyprenyl-3-methyl-5-hydroxy-6-metoxy-1,4-benzoquinol methylase
MNRTVTHTAPSNLDAGFLEEYSTQDSIRKYTKETAGNGISYLLDHDYGQIYLDVLEKYIPKSSIQRGVRVWEFGCGGGMNLVHLVAMMERRGIQLNCAYGTDFSEALIDAANREASKYLSSAQQRKVRFCVARNENLIDDVTSRLKLSKKELIGSFDLILGVNTIRYCHRLMNEMECVGDISELLVNKGVCIVIDMNDKFPAFRSRFRDRLTKEKNAYYLPTLDEYARPFSSAGFEILRKENFCWIPHSAGPGLTAVMKTLTPVLSTVLPSHAMRSLVISRKNQPAN